jgi:hypothetical protein
MHLHHALIKKGSGGDGCTSTFLFNPGISWTQTMSKKKSFFINYEEWGEYMIWICWWWKYTLVQQKQQKTFSALYLKGVMVRHGEIARVSCCPWNFMKNKAHFLLLCN